MNKIEQLFYDAFIDIGYQDDSIQAQVPIGIYVADFVLFNEECVPAVVEIDGHEWHKTKEQRFADYKKERFFMSQGYVVIRFMGSEVFVNPISCAAETLRLINDLTLLQLDEAYEIYRKVEERMGGHSNG